jgi:hypothetical protein
MHPRPRSIFEHSAPIDLTPQARPATDADQAGPWSESEPGNERQPGGPGPETDRPSRAVSASKAQPPARLVPTAAPPRWKALSPHPTPRAGDPSPPASDAQATAGIGPQPEREDGAPTWRAEPALQPPATRVASGEAAKPAHRPAFSEERTPDPSTRRLLTPRSVPDLPRQPEPVAGQRHPDGKSPGAPIQIHIGRVEVTAVKPPGKPVRRKPPRPSVMSLDEYLKNREEGERT